MTLIGKRITGIIVAVALIVLGGFYFMNGINDSRASKVASGFGAGQKVTVYKSPVCGCCVGYAEELEKQGFEVETISTEDMGAIKDKYGIPADKQSCHTIVMGDYFIEGHVPMVAVEKLLKEQPEIAGIGLPRMPSGTPGMPGPKRAPYEVYQSKDGEFSEFVTI